MNQKDFLLLVAGHLESAGIPFMVVGSFGSSQHGPPRTTNDVDIVIDPTPEQLDRWLSLLGGQFYVSADAAREALRSRSMFNIIHLVGGWKADLIVRKDRSFSIEEFKRRNPNIIEGRAIPVASAEDIILSKLEWNRITPSERQVRDAMNVATQQWPVLDQAYLRRWAVELGIADDLEQLLAAAATVQPPDKP